MTQPTIREGYLSMTGSNKVSLVELITKQKSNEFLKWVSLARDPIEGAVRITPKEMDNVYAEVMKFRQNRADYCKNYLNYYQPAFTAVEEAYQRKDFESFKKGLDLLLGLIGND